MPEQSPPTAPPRRRGRPRRGSTGSTDSRAQILASAIEEFGALGYDGATIRGIALRAGVDSALVHHYFGTKADLFAESVGSPIRPDLEVRTLLAGPRAELGASIVRYILETWERPDVRKRGVVMLRAALGSRVTAPLLAGFLSKELLGPIAAALEVPDAELRAALTASQIGGLIVTRYVLKLDAIASASVDDLVDRIGPTIQRYLTEE